MARMFFFFRLQKLQQRPVWVGVALIVAGLTRLDDHAGWSSWLESLMETDTDTGRVKRE